MQGPAGVCGPRNPLPARSGSREANVRAGVFPSHGMRSVPAGSFERLIAIEALWRAWLRCRDGKRRQPAMAAFDLEADRHLFRLQRELASGAYRPRPYRLTVVQDPKTRLIAAPAIRDRIVQTALIAEIGPTFERGFLPTSFACCRGRGQHRACLAFLAASRRYQFRLGLDVRRYFPSIDRGILQGLFARRLRDAKTRALLGLLIKKGGEIYSTPLAAQVLGLAIDPLPPGAGLPLGGYLSHWSGGLYLDGLDHFVKRELKIPVYLRYMDDFALFADDAGRLAEAHVAVREWLKSERRLELKPRGAVEPTTQPATFLGFRIRRAGVLPGPKARRRLRERLDNVGASDLDCFVRSLQAYRGHLLSL
jgi:RNA-directed DNA polymerase